MTSSVRGGQHDDFLGSRQLKLPDLAGISQHDYRRNSLQTVKRDPSSIPGIRQDKVADVQFSRWYGTSRHH